MKNSPNKSSKFSNSFLGMFFLIACLFASFDQQASGQNTCNTAISISPSQLPDTINYQFTDSVFWLSFVADSVNTEIFIMAPSNSYDSAAQFSSFSLYSGTCSALTLLFSAPLDSNNLLVPYISMNNLTIGNTYY